VKRAKKNHSYLPISVHNKSVHPPTLEIFYTRPIAQALVFDSLLKPSVETRAFDLPEPISAESELSHVARSKRKDSERFSDVGQREGKVKLGGM
jgi:hypothetical protein